MSRLQGNDKIWVQILEVKFLNHYQFFRTAIFTLLCSGFIYDSLLTSKSGGKTDAQQKMYQQQMFAVICEVALSNNMSCCNYINTMY